MKTDPLFLRLTRLEIASEDAARARRRLADAARHLAHDGYHWMLDISFEEAQNALRCGRNHLESAREVRE